MSSPAPSAASARRRRLIVHIGHHKTGSTTIQDAFATGRVELPGGRILYPAQITHNYLGHHVETWLKTGKALPGRPEMPGLAEIAARMASGDYDHTVISAEEFEGTDPAGLHRVMAEFLLPHVEEHRIICYLRPHAARVLSSFAEQMKLGLFDGTPEQFHLRSLKQRRFLYAEKLAPWRASFGEALHVRPMLRAELAEGSILRDFLVTAFGADSPVRGHEVPAANEALCLEDLVLLRRAQQIFEGADRRLRHLMGWELAMGFAAARRGGAAGTRLALHRGLAEKIRAAYRADAAESDRRFFGGRPVLAGELDRAVDEALPHPQSFEPADHHGTDALRGCEVMARTISAMLSHGGKSEWANFLLKRRVAAVHGGTAPAPAEMALAESVMAESVTAESVSGQARKAALDRPAPRMPAPRMPGPRLEAMPGPRLPRGQGISAATLEALLARPGNLATLSRRLGNVIMQSPRDTITLTAGDLARRLAQPGIRPRLRAVLSEFLVSLTFHHHAEDLAGTLRAQSPAALAGRSDDLGLALQSLSRAGGAVPALTEAGVHYLRGDLVPAYAAFDTARLALEAETVQTVGGHHLRGVLSLRALPLFAAWAAQPDLAPALSPLRFGPGGRFADTLPIVVVGMDGGYYRRYAARLAQTARGRANLHFHVANPGDVPLLEGPHLRHSFEETPGASNAYYATMRFLRLSELLTHYDRPLMTADADASFTGSPQALFDLLAGQDLVMNAARGLNTPRAYLAAVPWRHVTAQLLLVAPTAGARAWLETFGKLYAGLTADGAGPQWWVDQALLSATTDLMRHEGRAPRIDMRWLHPKSGMEQGKL